MNKMHSTAHTDLREHLNSDTLPQRIVFVRDLKLDAHIGAYEHEMGRTQPIIVNLTLKVSEPSNPESDKLEDIVCYDQLCQSITKILAQGHIKLVETLAEKIASMCLSHPLVLSAQVRVDKPDAIENASGAGVEILRFK